MLKFILLYVLVLFFRIWYSFCMMLQGEQGSSYHGRAWEPKRGSKVRWTWPSEILTYTTTWGHADSQLFLLQHQIDRISSFELATHICELFCCMFVTISRLYFIDVYYIHVLFVLSFVSFEIFSLNECVMMFLQY